MQKFILLKQKYSQHSSYLFLLTAYLILLTFFNNEAFATMVRPIGLNEMQKQAHVIYHARCISNRVDLDPQVNLVATWTTFELIEVLKNNNQQQTTFTIKQIGGTIPGGIKYEAPGVPRFKVGEEYILFLPKKSHLGFSSPIALTYGKFNVVTTPEGKQVTNNHNFSEMLKNIPDNKLTPGAKNLKHSSSGLLKPDQSSRMNINEFKSLLRNISNTNAPSGTNGANQQ